MKEVTRMMASLPMSTKQELLNLMRRFKREKFQPHNGLEGLTPSEANVIICIHLAKDHGVSHVQPRYVAQWLHLTPSALSQTLKILEEKDFIDRNRFKEDSRSVSLELTEKGAQFAERGASERDAYMDEFIEYMGEEEVKRLIASFNKILDFMSEDCSVSSSGEESPCE